jgi:hypothetical protein
VNPKLAEWKCTLTFVVKCRLNAVGVSNTTSQVTFTSIMVVQRKVIVTNILVTRDVVNPIFRQFAMQVSGE